jgi:hypothetical protein
MTLRPAGSGLALLTIMSIGAGPARAQSLGVRAVGADLRHQVLGGLFGAALVGTVPLGSAGTELVLAGEHLKGRSNRIGVPCAGLIEPGTCGPEQLRDYATASSLAAGVSGRIAGSGRLALSAGGRLVAMHLRTRTRGLDSGRELSANKTMGGAEVGLEGAWHPWGNTPLALVTGAAVGWQSPVRNEVLLDGYTPFEQGFRVARAWLGLTWRRP